MPHIIVEHSVDLGIDIPRLLQGLHATLAAQGVDPVRIKARAIPLQHTVVGTHGTTGHMVHVSVLLLAGRDTATKKAYGTALFDILRTHVQPADAACALTLEIRDMDKDTYFL